MSAERVGELVDRLRLQPHPEGGHYAEVFRSPTRIDASDGRGPRAALTSIYFLLRAGDVSRWHRVLSDEVWCHLEGATIELHRLDAAARTLHSTTLGPVAAATAPQCTVAAGVWQAARSTGGYSLATCMVAPGFDFADFALMDRDDPLRTWLAHTHPALSGF